jgi:ligand-binding sensor domain-containing protein
VIGLLLLQIVVVAAVWQLKRSAQRELAAAAADLARQATVAFDKRLLPAINGEGITLIQNSRAVRAVAGLGGSLVVATEGGLVELTNDGKLKRRFTVLDGLPESDLTALAEFGSQLFIGTRSQGLVMFDGSRFTAYRWTDRKAQAVTSLLVEKGRLLVGTFAGGLLEFDGKQFRELKAEDKRFNGIERVTADSTRMYVGTFAEGLWVSEGARWRHFTIADGLPSNRVVGVVANGDQLLVATDFGVAGISINALFAAEQKSFQTLATLPSLSSIVRYRNSILVSKDDGEIFQLVADARTNRTQLNPVFWRKPEELSSCQLNVFSGEQSLWLLSNEGIKRTGWQDERSSGSGRLNWTGFGELSESNQPNSNVVSAMAFDGVGNLWAGSFRNGIDVFTREGRRLTHLENTAVREINSLVWDESARQMIAATSQGLVQFNNSMQPKVVSKADGLLSNSILYGAPLQKTSSASSANLVLATSRGLMFGHPGNWAGNQAKQWQAMTAVQGLPSNSVYAVLPHRESIYAGTLSGLAQINSGRVVRVFNDSNSRLTNNWVTAICSVNGRLFVGTYGGGVFELTPSGELTGFASEIGKQVVNPNAMAGDDKRLYVGTLEGAWVLEFSSQKWTRLKTELPSSTVLSVAVDGENVYFGTTNGIVRINKHRLDFVRE